MGAIEAIRKANQPREPEDSIRLRVACTSAALVGIAAAASQGELSRLTALSTMALVSLGMAFSYRTRARPPGWIKILAAIGALIALAWFVKQIDHGQIVDFTRVEDPLTVLFAWIQVVHSFHVPSRRDVVFLAGASAGTMAVASAQAVNLTFGWYAALWLALGLWTLVELWAASSDGGRLPARQLASAGAAVGAAAVLVFLVLPAPTVAVRINFHSAAGDGGPIADPGALAGDSGSAAELSKAGSASGPTRIAGYLGFAGSLDTGLRGKLSKTLVMQVRAERPGYWIGETFNSWDGQSWSATNDTAHVYGGDSPIQLPIPTGDVAGGPSDLQTFYVEQATADLVFHANSARQVWFPAATLYDSPSGTVVSPIGIGHGAVYTVESQGQDPSGAQLSEAGGVGLPAGQQSEYTELPHPYPQVQALAESITAGQNTAYGKVEALISWMGANTHYSTDIPALPPGADTVDEFLFGNRTGYCEQISTSLAVMLRSLGIPTRETVGYVPGGYNPITDLFQVRADDAHAWVQVWFPGYGWQSFDPTAVVPESAPSPGATALTDVGRALERLPLIPIGLTAGVVAVLLAMALRWRSRPASWAEQLAARIERRGRRLGRPRRADETIAEYATALSALGPGPGTGTTDWAALADAVTESAYGGLDPPPEARRRLLMKAAGRS